MPRPKFTPGSTVTFPVKNRSGKKSLVAYLASRLGVVDNWALDLVNDGNVLLDGIAAAADTLVNLSAGPHEITVFFPETWPKHMAATEMPLDILYEDDMLLVLNKPAGIVVHPARGHLDNQTLQNGVRYRYRHLIGRDDATIGSPHRLDKDTSGAIIFALATDVYVDLVAQFSASTPHKTYTAILDGTPDFSDLLVDKPIGPDPKRKGCGTIRPPEEGGKNAQTRFAITESADGWAVAIATPFTGRPHQIRVHAASLGLPLAGDKEYNAQPDRLGFPRQALHASALSFTHPVTKKKLTVEAPLPEDMKTALERLCGSSRAEW